MNYKMFVKPAIRIAIFAAVVVGLLILFGVRWWVALAAVLAVIAVVALVAFIVIRRQRKKFTDTLKAFNIDPESGRVNPADLKRMYNSGGEAQKQAVMIYRMANNNCPEADAHKFFKSMSIFNRAEQMQEMQKMQAAQRKGKGKGKGNMFR
ncbi:MAG: hypothetical protein Q4A84_04015 [Neisseria sp.]|uniref:hypothetical protein n=1 Tax=Neisseria sp. TaxID=192066 RepID=UPI0026DA6FEC|nr:hypothetical protein [Neisseria sp.]MDO4640856.1 hypothetical protein [Neisseria sp.]